ncbi:ubiquitin carboxyl-terminal hydrolase (macronuclear) [Tetrahymena thermophila SB210]|uniref:ubiquitinyl hydrolase 1 n=1 Tax=Tetrahymena thermophila (strain SB210) TaxID=312017 RepID=Q23DA4_TETTS|nr:ubiquitin carboxyl-terminal hydrolase [Tetrahymena thermophila SB210]EAR94488.2 ubiquitin carboxyl-terminal hydrolase [Tetrahymena thermophila SB210]|eukprot:XP_001014782.2 ubiquitin carboxyl-terminal hydrolase [Tetrahymena thermophila SB210]
MNLSQNKSIPAELICKHMNNINPLHDTKYQQEKFKKFISENKIKKIYNQFNQEMYQSNPEEWICLHDGCDSVFLRQQQDSFSILKHCENQANEEDNHCIFINCQTCLIHCIACDVEILDLEMYGQEKQEELKNWPNPRKIRDIFHSIEFDWDSNLLKSNLSNPKSHWKSNRGLCSLINSTNTSFINCIIQIFSNIPIIKKVFQKMHKVYGNINNCVPKSPVKRVSFFFTKLLYNMWTGQERAIKPQEFYSSLYQVDPSFRGYGFKDTYEFFKKFINILHDDFKYIGKKIYDMKKTQQTTKDLQEEWDVINNIKDYCDYSIISQTFKGKLCVRAQCTQCEFVYWCEEDFTGIALDIPDKDWKPQNDQWAFKEKQKEKNTKDLNIFSKLFTSNKQQKPVKREFYTLSEYLAYFCENSVVSEKKVFFCEDCKMKVNVSKSCNFLTLPNILCLQISRFKQVNGQNLKLNDPIDIPIDNLDLSPFMKQFDQYDQQLTQYELLGIVEHEKQLGGDSYNTYIKNYKNNMFYKFSNSQFKPFDIATNIKDIQPYLLFYKLKQKPQNALFRNLHSQVQLIKQGELQINFDKSAYIPCFWYEKLKYLANPGIIHTQHLLCNHSKIKPDFFDCFPPKTSRNANSILMAENSNMDPTMIMDLSHDNDADLETNYAVEFLKNQSVIVPIEIASYLLESYGGGPMIESNLPICQECVRLARNIKRRRKMEKNIISKFESKFTEETYIIDENWMIKWKDYLYSNKKFFKRNFIKGMPPPGTIDNKQLLGPQNTLKPGLKKNVNFRIVNDYIWQIFKFLYQGGPALVINDYNSRKKNYQKPQLSKADLEQLQEMLLLVDEKKYSDLMKTILTEDLTQNNQNKKTQNIPQKPQVTSLLQKQLNQNQLKGKDTNGSQSLLQNNLNRQTRSISYTQSQSSKEQDSNQKNVNKNIINRSESIDNPSVTKASQENQYSNYNGNPRIKIPVKQNYPQRQMQNRSSEKNQINNSTTSNKTLDKKNLDLNIDKIKI